MKKLIIICISLFFTFNLFSDEEDNPLLLGSDTFTSSYLIVYKEKKDITGLTKLRKISESDMSMYYAITNYWYYRILFKYEKKLNKEAKNNAIQYQKKESYYDKIIEEYANAIKKYSVKYIKENWDKINNSISDTLNDCSEK